MDNGDVIPGLNEDWTFAGAKMLEWMAGLVMMMLVASCFHRPAHYMPLLIIIWIGTTLSMAMLRKQFPDEERGVRNMLMVAAGFEPPGIPPPAKVQPLWSGAPMRDMRESTHFSQLGLVHVVNRGDGEVR